MALFKILRGPSSELNNLPIIDGYCYFTPDTGLFYIDYNDQRVPLNAKDAETLMGASLVHVLNDADTEEDEENLKFEIPSAYLLKQIVDDLKFDTPVAYNPYVEEAKKQYVGEYSNLAILEESQYITVAFLMDDFTVTEYNKSSTEFKAQGWVAVSCKKADQTWEIQNWMASPSEGHNFASNIRSSSCYWYYNGENIWPIGGSGAGEKVTGREFEIDEEIIVAAEGAEIFNDYVNNIATGSYSHAEGTYTAAYGNYGAHAEGEESVARGDSSHAEGYYATANGDGSHAEGYNTKANGDYAHAEGYESKAKGQCSHTEGAHTIAEGYGAHAEGDNTIAIDDFAHAEGSCTVAIGWGSHAEGDSTFAVMDNTHAEGSYTIAYESYDHAEGEGYYESVTIAGEANSNTYTLTTRNASKAKNIKIGAFVSYNGALAEIEEWDITTYTAVLSDTLDSENALSNARGYVHIGGIARGGSSHTEGYGSVASGYASHAEGEETTASGYDAHAEGYSTWAIGDTSHAEGCLTIAGYDYAHAEGDHTAAVEYAAHAEGLGIACSIYLTGDAYSDTYTINSINSDHAKIRIGNALYYNGAVTYIYKIIDNSTIKLNDTLSKDDSLNNTEVVMYYGGVASGWNSHVEGLESIAAGLNSHAEGAQTEALGWDSHSEGSGTIASSLSQHVQGRYNIPEATPEIQGGTLDIGTYAHIVGNGTDEENRSNAHTLDWNGEAWFAGDVYVGSTSGTNKDGGSIKLATIEEVNALMETGGDMLSAIYDPQGKATDIFTYIDNLELITVDDIDEICGASIKNVEEVEF